MLFVFYRYGDHRDLHVLTPSFPTLLSSNLGTVPAAACCSTSPAAATSLAASALCWRTCRRASRASATRRARPWPTPSAVPGPWRRHSRRSEEHTSELQSLMRTSYAVFCLKKKNNTKNRLPSRTEQLVTQHILND